LAQEQSADCDDMKIEFEKVTEPYQYPFSVADTKLFLQKIVPTEILANISKIHYGCNQQTTQEARIVERGQRYDLRINFCPKAGTTKLLSVKTEWCRIVLLCGGTLDKAAQNVAWTPESARKYVMFLIAHEIAHLLYASEKHGGSFRGSKTSAIEEAWCDRFARESLAIQSV
jgi:hypothetical protein